MLIIGKKSTKISDNHPDLGNYFVNDSALE